MDLLPPASAYLAFLAAAGAIVLMPGPDTVTVLSQGATRGRRAGVETALGVSSGVMVHATAVALGLAALLEAVPAAYALVKFVGAAYLLYLGITTLRSDDPLETTGGRSNTDAATDSTTDSATSQPYRAGFVVNATNPKVAIFFLAFLPAFAGSGPDTGLRILVLGVTYSVLSLLYRRRRRRRERPVSTRIAQGAARNPAPLRGCADPPGSRRRGRYRAVTTGIDLPNQLHIHRALHGFIVHRAVPTDVSHRTHTRRRKPQ